MMRDDYNWGNYPEEFNRWLVRMEKTHTLRILPKDATYEPYEVRLRPGVKPLPPSYRCLYEIIGALHPSTVCEVGCGPGDHLANLQMLFPDLGVTGMEISDKMAKLAHSRNPSLKATTIQVGDITKMAPQHSAELVFTHTVLQHIHGSYRELDALFNIFQGAVRFILLCENFERHDFVRMAELVSQNMREVVPWYPYLGGNAPLRFLLLARIELTESDDGKFLKRIYPWPS